MKENLTSHSRTVLEFAAQEARDMRCPYVGTEHLLLGLIRNNSVPGIDLDPARKILQNLVGEFTEPQVNGDLPMTPRAKLVMQSAVRKSADSKILPQHMLSALSELSDCLACRILKEIKETSGT